MFRGAKKRTFRFGKKNVSFPKVETFRFADYTIMYSLFVKLHLVTYGLALHLDCCDIIVIQMTLLGCRN